MRGDVKVVLKLSLSAKASVAAQFKAEAALLNSVREAGVHNVTRVLGREMGRLGVSCHGCVHGCQGVGVRAES